jgi:hypothetical protein
MRRAEAQSKDLRFVSRNDVSVSGKPQVRASLWSVRIIIVVWQSERRIAKSGLPDLPVCSRIRYNSFTERE